MPRGGQLAGQLRLSLPNRPDGQVIHSQKQNIKIEIIASGMETPWGKKPSYPMGAWRLIWTPERSGALARNRSRQSFSAIR